jgi:putative phage-type endonuclease
MGAVLSLSPWKSAYTLWAEKCGLVELEDFDSKRNVAMRVGQLVEPAIFQLFVEQHPNFVLRTVGTFAHKDYSWVHANPDGLGVDENGVPFILEIKHSAQYWDGVPEHYKAQVYWYMFVFGVRKAIFAVLNAGRYKEFEIVWDDFTWSVIWQRAEQFRQSVLDRVAPEWDGSDSTFETVRAMSPDIESRNEELGQIGIELWKAHVAAKDAETELQKIKAITIDALNGAKNGTIDGVIVCTLSQRSAGKPYLTIKEK